MMRTKEDLLGLLKSSIQTSMDKRDELDKNEELRVKWKEELAICSKEIPQLPAEDYKWLGVEYAKWAKENLTDHLNTFIDSHLQRK